jgi:Protein of unknown function (DUF3040)
MDLQLVVVGNVGREGGVMDLSVRERIVLRRLESQLSREDPALAAHLGPPRPRQQRMLVLRPGFLRVAVPMLVGMQVAVVGVTVGSQLLTVVGLIYIIVGPCGALLVSAWRR